MTAIDEIRAGFEEARQAVSDPSVFTPDQVWALREMLDALEKRLVKVVP